MAKVETLTHQDYQQKKRDIVEQFYRGYETDMAAVVPPIGMVNAIEEQQRQAEHFWNKRMKEASRLLDELFLECLGGDEPDTDGQDLRAGTFERGQDKRRTGRNQLRASIRQVITGPTKEVPDEQED